MSKLNYLILIIPAFSLIVAFSNCSTSEFKLAESSEVLRVVALGEPVVVVPDVPNEPDLKVVCTTPEARGTANTASRRLTKGEILNSFSDLFEPVYMTRDIVVAAALSIPDDSTAFEKSQFDPILQSSHIESVIRLSEALVTAVRAFRQNLYGGCVNAAPVTKACFTTFVKNFGRKAWRRPLTDIEVESFATSFWVANSTKSFEDVVPALMASPEFLLLLEYRTSAGLRRRLNDYEVASRISFMTINSIPDAILRTAADNNQLTTLKQVQDQVARLLLSPRGKDSVIRSLIRYVGSESIADPNAPAGVAQKIATLNLAIELKQELVDYITYIVFEKNGTYGDLMTSPAVFPKTSRLAELYGTSVWTPGQPIINAPTEERAGLWTKAAVLATSASHTKPFSRGVNFRKRILCQSLPSPDPSVIASRDDLIRSLSPLEFSNREIHTQITSSTSCMGCHSQINPIGFGLERFNELGAFRRKELVLNPKGEVLASHPVDFMVQLQLAGAQAAVSVNTTDSFIKTLTLNSTARSCFAETLFQERRFRNVVETDQCALSDLKTKLSENKPVHTILTESIANEDIFWNGSN